ncbi:MAG: hypothetical protein V4634_10920 [Pseudomonadota bacterium]
MKKLVLISILSALSWSASAQTVSDSDTVTISGAERTIALPDHYSNMWPDQFRDYLGAYSLSNGKILTVFSRGTRVYAKLQDQSAHQLVATAANTFVALDRKLKMRIELRDNGDVGGELLMAVPRESLSGGGTGEQLVSFAFR